MKIVIPTYRRTDDQVTFLGLPSEWWSKTYWIVDDFDAKRLEMIHRSKNANIIVHPEGIDTIAKKRAWIIENFSGDDHIMMFDDDLRFAYRADPESTKLTPAPKNIVGEFLTNIEHKFQNEHYRHLGISARQGNNTKPGGWEENTRMMYALGWHLPTLREHCELGRIETREDMDYTLQLLKKGFPNAVLNDLAVDQVFNKKGGCSTQRTMEASNADAYKLAELHPGLVKPKEKAYKSSIPRVEVTCYWKKAFVNGDLERAS